MTAFFSSLIDADIELEGYTQTGRDEDRERESCILSSVLRRWLHNSEIWCGLRWSPEVSIHSSWGIKVEFFDSIGGTSRSTLYRATHLCRWTVFTMIEDHRNRQHPGKYGRCGHTNSTSRSNTRAIIINLRRVRSASRADLRGLTAYPDIFYEYRYRNEGSSITSPSTHLYTI